MTAWRQLFFFIVVPLQKFLVCHPYRKNEKVGLDFSQHDEHYGLALIGERELAEYEEHIREKVKK